MIVAAAGEAIARDERMKVRANNLFSETSSRPAVDTSCCREFIAHDMMVMTFDHQPTFEPECTVEKHIVVSTSRHDQDESHVYEQFLKFKLNTSNATS